MNSGVRTIEVPVSEGNLHAELEALFRRYHIVNDDENVIEVRLANTTLRENGPVSKAVLKISKNEEVN